jgi:hypothetical protein
LCGYFYRGRRLASVCGNRTALCQAEIQQPQCTGVLTTPKIYHNHFEEAVQERRARRRADRARNT